MKSLFRRARFERRNSFNPEEAPPPGDIPHLAGTSFDDLDDDINVEWSRAIWLIVGIGSVFGIVVLCLLALSTILAFPASAQSPSDIAACKSDAVQICSATYADLVDFTRIKKCMVAHRLELTAKCASVLKAHGL